MEEAAALPGVRKELAAAQQRITELEGNKAELQEAVAAGQRALQAEQEARRGVEQELASTRDGAAAAESAAEEIIQRLNADVSRMEARPCWAHPPKCLPGSSVPHSAAASMTLCYWAFRQHQALSVGVV